MHTEYTFTLAELAAGFVTICGGISVIAGTIALLLRAIHKFREPEESQNQRLSDVEAELEKHMGYLDNDHKRLDAIEEGHRVTQRALLALLSHSLDGNDVEALKESKKELQEYLIKR